MSESEISPNKKHEDQSENGSAEQDLGGRVYQPVTVDCRVGEVSHYIGLQSSCLC